MNKQELVKKFKEWYGDPVISFDPDKLYADVKAASQGEFGGQFHYDQDDIDLFLQHNPGIKLEGRQERRIMKITKRQLQRIIREAMDYDPLGDAGVPYVGVRPEYALAFVDIAYGDRRIEFVVKAEDAELAREVMKKMRGQGQVSGVQPTRQRFDSRDVTTREDLMRMLNEVVR
jgi:hypothetical protein